MQEQEKSRYCEPVCEIVGAGLACRLAEKGRQAQELVTPRLACSARDGTSAARRDVGALSAHTGGRTALKIEAEAELAEQHQLEPYQRRTRTLGVDEK